MILFGDYAPADMAVQINCPGCGFGVINLEGPVLDKPERFTKAQKAGPCLYSRSLPKAQQPLVYSLANNHIMDYGFNGVSFTTDEIKKRMETHAVVVKAWIRQGNQSL